MSKITEKIKVLLGIAKAKFGKVATDKAEIFYDGDELAVDTKVYNDEGAPVEDGEYADEKTIYTIKDSVVVEVRPKEEVKEEVEEKTEKTEKTETTETTEKEEMADETITEEVKEERIEEVPAEPTIDERVEALEELVETLYEEIRNMKAREAESVERSENIIREFSAMKHSPTAQSVTMACENEKKFEKDCSKVDKLKALKGKK